MADLRPFRFAALLSALLAASAHASTITIVNLDGPGEGFNDPTPAAPVGGNPGTTIGAQRLYVFQYAANIWAGLLPSSVAIKVDANFDPLSCSATSGVLGSAGPTTLHRDFTGAPFAGTWYHQALANRLHGSDLSATNDDIAATFNSSVGGASCLPAGWYYGVDGNEGGQIELLPVVLHELGHGLGFSTSTNGQTGAYAGSPAFPHVWDHFLYDDTQGMHWTQMTQAQRAASGINCQKLVWDGAQVIANAPYWLGPKPVLRVNSPPGVAGDYNIGVASFGPALASPGVTGNVVLVNDGVGTVTNGCEPFGGVAGKIALVDRGACSFTIKVKNAQNAGAIGVIVADSVAGCPPTGMGGSDPSITIPSVRVTQSDGLILKGAIAAGLNVTLRVDASMMAGADASGRVEMYTPNPYQSGSSVSHWDTSAQPDLLMEPALNPSLSSNPDLTFALFADIGWFQGFSNVGGGTPLRATRLGASVPNPVVDATTISYTLAHDEKVTLMIYDPAGRQVRRLATGSLNAGPHTVTWDGRDRAGRPVPPGVYLYVLQTPDGTESKHLVLER